MVARTLESGYWQCVCVCVCVGAGGVWLWSELNALNWTYHDELAEYVRQYVGARVPVLPLLARDCDKHEADHYRPDEYDSEPKDANRQQRRGQQKSSNDVYDRIPPVPNSGGWVEAYE